MSYTHRSSTLASVAERVLDGAEFGYEVKDFLHEFMAAGRYSMLQEKPAALQGRVTEGRRWDAFLQALAVYLAVKMDCNPPDWTRNPIQLADPWFAAAGTAVRNYLLLSSPTPFRMRNLFIDEDSLTVV